MSDLAYTVVVIKNGHEVWEQLNENRNSSGEGGLQGWGGEEFESSTKKTPKFTKKAGKKRECNTSGLNHEGIHFYNKVQDEWKRLASENKEQRWEQLEAEWSDYIEDYKSLNFYGRSRKRKMNNSTDSEDMPSLPSMDVCETMLVNNDYYQPDCPWKMPDFDDDDQPRRTLNRVSMGDNYELDGVEFEGGV
jgi:hypothetical protein